MRCRLLDAVAVLAMLTTSAFASPKLNQARKLFAKAQKAFAAEDFALALDRYKAAYELAPRAGFKFNMAQCYHNLGDHKAAAEHYRAYLEAAPNSKLRAAAEKLLAENERLYAEQQAAAEAEARRIAEEQRRADAEAKRLQEADRGLSTIYFWSGVGLTAGMAIAATTTGIMTLSKHSTFEDTSLPQAERDAAKADGEQLRTMTNIFIGVAAASAVATTVLYFFTDFGRSDPSETSGPSISFAPTLGGGVTMLRTNW